MDSAGFSSQEDRSSADSAPPATPPASMHTGDSRPPAARAARSGRASRDSARPRSGAWHLELLRLLAAADLHATATGSRDPHPSPSHRPNPQDRESTPSGTSPT